MESYLRRFCASNTASRVTEDVQVSTQGQIASNGVMAELIRRYNWANHPLGEIQTWPETLVDVINLLLASPLPMQVYWGSEMFTLYNDALLPFLQDRHPHCLGRPVREVWPEAMAAIGAQLSSVFTTGESVMFESAPLTLLQDGVWEPMFWTYAYSAVYGRDGKIAGVLNISQNVTGQKRAEDQLIEAKNMAEEANRAKSEFLANMSHELRTPLSAVIGYSELLEEEMEDSDSKFGLEDIRKIQSNARHLLSLINDVLDLSKIEADRMTTYAEEFAVADLLRDVQTTMGGLVSQKGNELLVQQSDDLGSMHTDQVKLRQCLFNLISNAAKFTERGTVTLHAYREGTALVFAVADSGIGMTPEQTAKLFERFTQADASTTRKFGGTGLGLAITRAFCHLLGGEIGVTSVYGEGSTFTIRIPAFLPEPVDMQGHAAKEIKEDKHIVLVIDDDESQRELLTRFLEREGFAVRVASTGRAGIELAREVHPRAILLDVVMPQMDGWSVLNVLKSDPALERIPVVMVTFVNEPGLGESLGAVETVQKPVEWEHLKSVMERFRGDAGDILVVDDDADARARLRTVLQRNGWSVSEASDGQKALDMVLHAPPQLILLDLTMPVMDGFAFLHELRGRPGVADIPVVVLSARDLDARDRNRLEGADQVLSKGDTNLRKLAGELRSLTPARADR